MLLPGEENDVSERLQSLLVAHGALIFLAGMAAGFPFAFEILGRVELWPIPGSVEADLPGDYRAWRMAHLEGILNGLLLISVGSVGGKLRLSRRAAAWVAWGLVVTGWANLVASWIGPLSETRGLSFTGLSWNSVVFLLFMVAVVAVLIAMWLVFRGASANARKPSG
jgi:hypothetical protein